MIELLEAVHLERGIPIEMLYEAIEEALTTAARVDSGTENTVVTIDRTTGEVRLYERFRVVAEVADSAIEIAKIAGYEPGDFYDRPLDVKDFGRVAALTARQVVSKRVIEFERERVFSKYRALEGKLVKTLVQRVERGNVYVLLDSDNEGCLPSGEYAGAPPPINDWLWAVIDSVRKTARGPAILLSRASERFIRAMLPNCEVHAVARGTGPVLVAVRTLDRSGVSQLEYDLGKRVVLVEYRDDTADFIVEAFAALGEQLDQVVLEPDDMAIVTPAVDQAWKPELVGQLVGRVIIATDDISAGREQLATERLTRSIETGASDFRTSNDVEDLEADVDPAVLAELLRFRDEKFSTDS